MENKNQPVWVIAEQIECRILGVSLQLVGQARKLADKLGASVEAVLLGENIRDRARQLIEAGADRIYAGESPELADYQPDLYTQMIVELAEARKPDIILLGSTSMGRELAPQVAARLRTGLTAHCIDLALDDQQILEQRIPAYGGLLAIICPQKRPQMATIAGGVFPMPEMDAARQGEIIALQLPQTNQRRIQTLEVVREAPQGVQLESAAVIVAGGAGAGDPNGWQQIDDLAKTLNAALGCTRPAVDEGWADLETMIGQSGKMVSPACYIGVGLSGEQQHMVGVVGAQIMVAVNNDAKSPVFEQVDIGIVDDCREFIPVLIAKIKEYRDKQATC